MPNGIIVKGIGGFYYIETDSGLYECRARGIFRNNEITPLPGDNVIISIEDEEKKIGNIEKIIDRDNFFVRPSVANVNQMLIVVSVNSPKIDYYLLDKLLLTAEKKNINPVICINKIDLDLESYHRNFMRIYKNIGYDVFATSSKTKTGYEKLKNVLENKISVFAGQSGVGKSTILNNILNELVMETGDISKKIKRGKHTTRHAELIELKEGGYIVDTPGFSSFLLENIEFEELENYYREFKELIGICKYSGCSHISEPGCKVKNNFVDGYIDKGRYERYVFFYNELKKEKSFIWKKRKKAKR
ncbi:MAG: ribosome small subunit-dependent GTPase A [Clostridiales bacterium]